MAWIMVDVETVGPVSDAFVPESLASIGETREHTLSGEDPAEAMHSYEQWLLQVSPRGPRFVSDNNGFDWMFVCWYFHQFLGRNPSGYSSTKLGNLYEGLTRSARNSFTHLRQSAHTHDPQDDARGNAEALLAIKETMGLGIDL